MVGNWRRFVSWLERRSSNGGIFPNYANWGVASGGGGGGLPSSGAGTPVYCRAAITLKNSGNKTIRAVYLDYVFTDQATGQEFLRYQLRASKWIKPGDTKKLRHDIYQKAGKNRKAFLPLRPRLNQVLRTRDAATDLVIRRIEYADGTAHQY